jgi:pimeloyl-ACP methyl ester carboxylesterase
MEYATNPLDGTRLTYRVTAGHVASGTPVVLVHGTALSQAVWRALGYLRELSPARPVITLDLRGHGRSDKPHDGGDYAMDWFLADVLTVIDHLGFDRVHYLGYSLGGRLGFSLAASHPTRLASFVSVAGAPATGVGVFDRVFFDGSIEALERGGMEGFLAEWELASGAPVDPATRTAFTANDPHALAAYMRAAELEERVPDAAISAFPMPVLLAAGTRDRPRLEAAEHVHALLPTSQLLLLEGATHANTPAHPSLLPAVREFLAAADTH